MALKGFDVLTLRCLIQTLGASAMLLQTIALRRPLAVEREAWPDLVIAALLNMTVLPLSFTVGVYLLGPGRTSVLVYTMPIWATLFARIILGERLTVTRTLALAFGAGAVAALMSQNLPELRNAPLGGAVTLVIGNIVRARHRLAEAPGVAGRRRSPGLLAIGDRDHSDRLDLAGAPLPPDLAEACSSQWLAAMFLGMVGNGFAYFAWFRIVALLPAGAAGIGTLITPCVAVISSVWLTGETLHPHDLVAIALIGMALLLVTAEQLSPALRLLSRRHSGRSGGL